MKLQMSKQLEHDFGDADAVGTTGPLAWAAHPNPVRCSRPPENPRSNPRHWLHRGPAAKTVVPPCECGSRSAASHSLSPARSPNYVACMRAGGLAAEAEAQWDRRPTSDVVWRATGEACATYRSRVKQVLWWSSMALGCLLSWVGTCQTRRWD